MGKCSICAILFIPPPHYPDFIFHFFFFFRSEHYFKCMHFTFLYANNKRSHMLNYVTIRSLKIVHFGICQFTLFTKQRNSSVKEGYKVYREIGDCLSFAYFRKICWKMALNKLAIDQIDVSGKRVLMR